MARSTTASEWTGMVVAVVAVLVLVVGSDLIELSLARRSARRRAPLVS